MIAGKRAWWLGGATAAVAAGFAVYDFRDSLPSRYAVEDFAQRACARLPMSGLDGRYPDLPSCPWNPGVGPKQEFSGLVLPSEHGAAFLLDDGSPKRTEEAYRQWVLYGPRWHIEFDGKAFGSFERVSGKGYNPIGREYRVTLRGWRTREPGRHSEGYATYPHILFVDEFIDIEQPSD